MSRASPPTAMFAPDEAFPRMKETLSFTSKEPSTQSVGRAKSRLPGGSQSAKSGMHPASATTIAECLSACTEKVPSKPLNAFRSRINCVGGGATSSIGLVVRSDTVRDDDPSPETLATST